MEDINIIVEKIKVKGLKITPQRLAIVKSLQGDKSHPSASDIYNRLKGEYPSLSLATVYNTLDTLKELGELIELNISKDKCHYDPDVSSHDHIICVSCKKIDDILQSKNEGDKHIFKNRIKRFKVLEVRRQFYGICSECLDKSE